MLPLRTLVPVLALLAAPTAVGQGPAFPGASWPTATPASQNLDSNALTAAIAGLPFPANIGPMVIIANGHLVHTVGDETSPRDLFSCSKVVTGMVAAKLIEDGTLPGLDHVVPNSVPNPPWSAYPGDSTIREFLTMTSDYGLTPYKPAGGQYAYNNNGIHFLGEYLGQTQLGLPAGAMATAVRQELFATLRHQDTVQFNGQWGGWFGGLKASARDVARLGYLLMRGGQWQGQRLLDEEFVDGLFRSQIPASASAYQSGDPNQNTQFNQQAFTDLLGGNWSFGMWRVGPARADGSYACIAAEGYRGKRIVLMPRGTLPDPLLEVVLVTLPQLSDEGPPSTVYRNLIANAVIAPNTHPDQDPRCGIATFDDGTLAPLEPQRGAAFVDGGAAVLDGAQRMVFRSAPLDDGRALLRLSNGLSAGSRVGFTVRAASPLDDWNAPGNGSQTTVWMHQDASRGVRAEVEAADGTRIHTSGWRSALGPGTPLNLHIHFVGDRIACRINTGDVIPLGNLTGIPDPAAGGYLSVRSQIVGATPALLDYVMIRPEAGPIAQVQNTLNGHTLGLLDRREIPALKLRTFFIDTAGFPVDPWLFTVAQPYMWPNILGLDDDHFMVSSDGAVAPIPSGTEVRFRYDGRREGVFNR